VDEDSSGLPLAVIISSLDSVVQSSSAVKNSVAKMPLPVKNSVAQASLPVIKKAGKQAGVPIPTKAGIHPRSSERQTIIAIEDRWRIDDEWWRSEPVSRFYYSVRFASGQLLVIYKDLIQGKWYKQGY
jgi:hypothetical protein